MMKKHILSTVAQQMPAMSNTQVYYNADTQISYMDEAFTQKVISAISIEKSIETRVVENTDEDEFVDYGKTTTTFTKEDSDADEFRYFGKSIVTETVEESDPDEFIYKMGSTEKTVTIEVSDPDEFRYN